MSSLEKFIEDTNSAKSQEQVFEIFKSALKDIGLDSVVYSLLTDHKSINKPKGHGLVSNYPQDWMKFYIENNYFELDPIPRYAFTTKRAYTWKHVTESQRITKPQLKLMNQAEDAGLRDGIACAIYGPNGEIAGVGLANSVGGLSPDKNTLDRIRMMAEHFHIVYS